MKFKIGDKIKVLKGVYSGKEGEVQALSEDAQYSIGVNIAGQKIFIIWFEPDAIEIAQG